MVEMKGRQIPPFMPAEDSPSSPFPSLLGCLWLPICSFAALIKASLAPVISSIFAFLLCLKHWLPLEQHPPILLGLLSPIRPILSRSEDCLNLDNEVIPNLKDMSKGISRDGMSNLTIFCRQAFKALASLLVPSLAQRTSLQPERQA